MSDVPLSRHLLGAGLTVEAINDVASWKRRTYAQGIPFRLTSAQPRVLERGWVFAGMTLPSGRRQEVHLFLPGDFIDLSDSMSKTFDLNPASSAIVADVPENASGRPEFQAFTAQGRVTKDALMFAHALRLGGFDAIGRIAHFLLETECRLRASASEHSPVLGWPLRQTHIADYLSLGSVHVCRTLLKLKSAGLADVSRGLRIYDRKGLADIFSATRREALATAS